MSNPSGAYKLGFSYYYELYLDITIVAFFSKLNQIAREYPGYPRDGGRLDAYDFILHMVQQVSQGVDNVILYDESGSESVICFSNGVWIDRLLDLNDMEKIVVDRVAYPSNDLLEFLTYLRGRIDAVFPSTDDWIRLLNKWNSERVCVTSSVVFRLESNPSQDIIEVLRRNLQWLILQRFPDSTVAVRMKVTGFGWVCVPIEDLRKAQSLFQSMNLEYCGFSVTVQKASDNVYGISGGACSPIIFPEFNGYRIWSQSPIRPLLKDGSLGDFVHNPDAEIVPLPCEWEPVFE